MHATMDLSGDGTQIPHALILTARSFQRKSRFISHRWKSGAPDDSLSAETEKQPEHGCAPDNPPQHVAVVRF